jgi:predicted ATPase
MLRDRIAVADHIRLRYQCSPYHTNSALHPIIDQLERAAGFARDDSFDIRLDKLESLLAQSSTDPAEAVPLLAALLSIPTGDRFAPLEMSPELQKERTLAALIDQMNGLAAPRPVLVIFEDAHWIDPTSQELLDLIVDQAQAIKALVVITYRPVFTAPWGGHPHVTSLTLNRLGRRQSQTMVGALTANKPLPEEVLDQILAKTDGVPLFVEELTKTVLEAGFLKEEEDRYVLTGPLPPLKLIWASAPKPEPMIVTSVVLGAPVKTGDMLSMVSPAAGPPTDTCCTAGRLIAPSSSVAVSVTA